MPLFTSHPTAHTEPAPGVFGSGTPSNITNQGHDDSCITAGNGLGNPADVGISIEWRSFQLPSAPVVSMTLKADWRNDGSTSSILTPFYELDYSLDNGSNWTAGVVDSDVNAPGSATFSQAISASQNISLIRIRHLGLASVQNVETEFCTICIGMSNVRLEIIVVSNPQPILIG